MHFTFVLNAVTILKVLKKVKLCIFYKHGTLLKIIFVSFILGYFFDGRRKFFFFFFSSKTVMVICLKLTAVAVENTLKSFKTVYKTPSVLYLVRMFSNCIRKTGD